MNQISAHVPGNIMDSPGYTTDIQGMLGEVLSICHWERDTSSLVSDLARSCGARAMRIFQHDDGDLREVASWPGPKATSLALPLGLRERLLRSREASSVRACTEKLSKT